jgi:AcrR family transcriptional regulator
MSESRERLLAAAAAEFARYGLAGTRVQAVVRRAGVNERMIYHHFGSKEGLYEAVLADQVGDLGDAWRVQLAECAELPPLAGMRQAMRGFFELLRSRPLLAPLLVQEAQLGWTVRPGLDAAALPAPLREIYERGQRDGVFRSEGDFAVFYAAAMAVLVAAPWLRGLLADRVATDEGSDALRDQLVDLVLHGIVGPAPPVAA